MKLKQWSTALLLFGWVSIVEADGIAVLGTPDQNQSESMTIEYKDGDKIRMSTADNPDGYMLIRGAKAYTVASMQGQTMVMDMAQMAQMARNMGAGMEEEDDDIFKFELLEMKDTGRTETIAGYKGKVYRMKWKDKDGIQTEEVVLSQDPAVVEFSHSWMHMAETMARLVADKPLPENSLGIYLHEHKQGFLRLGKDFVVSSIQSKPLPDARFNVPKSTFQMPSFGG